MAGRPSDESDTSILSSVDAEGDPWVATGDVAAVLSIGHNGVYRRLVSLEEDGLVESKRFGNSLAWRVTDKGTRFLEQSDT